MNVDFKRFLALSTLMAAPLIGACDINLDPGDDDGTSAAGTDGATSTATGDDGGDTTMAGDEAPATAGDTAADTAADTAGGTTAVADGSSEGPAPDVGDCCTAHADPGCSIPTIEECVCAADMLCCDVEGGWDEVCAALVDSEGCGMCPDVGMTGGTDGGTAGGSTMCCDSHDTPGCDDPKVQACVCEMDAFCCDEDEGAWDETCVTAVDKFGCGMCGA